MGRLIKTVVGFLVGILIGLIMPIIVASYCWDQQAYPWEETP